MTKFRPSLKSLVIYAQLMGMNACFVPADPLPALETTDTASSVTTTFSPATLDASTDDPSTSSNNDVDATDDNGTSGWI